VRSGTLTEGALPGLLRRLYIDRKSGTLALQRESERHALHLSEGQIVQAEGSVEGLGLDAMLLEQGLVSSQELAQARQEAERDGKPLACVLADNGRVEKDRLDAVRSEQLRTVVRRLAAWTAGTYGFTETKEPPAVGVATGAPMGDLIIEAVQALSDADVARFALGDLDRVVVHSPDPLLRFQKIALEPTDGYMLSRVDGTLTAREVSQLLPHSPDEFVVSLYRLYCAGLIDFLDAPVRRGRAGSDASEGPRPQAAPKTSQAPPPPPPQPSAAAPPPPSSAAPPQRPSQPAPRPSPPPAANKPAAAPDDAKPALEEARRKEVLALHAELKTRNHFEILGLTRKADAAQVKEAYFQLARRYHPDVFRGPAFADVAEQVEAIFIRLGQAFEVLKDPKQRGDYEAMVASREPRTPPAQGGASGGAPSAPAGPDPDAEARLAEEAVRRAEKLLPDEKYWDAIQLVEPHVGNARGNVLVRARMLLARCYLKNPNWVKRAEEQFNLVLNENPRHVEALFQLGQLYMGGGLKHRALAKFRKAAELDPLHDEARKRVAELSSDLTPEPEEPEPSGGFMKRIFGKGN